MSPVLLHTMFSKRIGLHHFCFLFSRKNQLGLLLLLEALADLETHLGLKPVSQLMLLADFDFARRLLPAASKPRSKSLAVAACCSLILLRGWGLYLARGMRFLVLFVKFSTQTHSSRSSQSASESQANATAAMARRHAKARTRLFLLKIFMMMATTMMCVPLVVLRTLSVLWVRYLWGLSASKMK